MLLFIILLRCLLIFKNSLFYTMALLLISVSVLSYLVLFCYISTLTSLMLIIVYLGAMMILIGYICSISPNLNLEPNFTVLPFALFRCVLYILFDVFDSVSVDSSNLNLVDYFYSIQGLVIITTLVLILFITLLIVTSQYLVPRGPFRSICV